MQVTETTTAQNPYNEDELHLPPQHAPHSPLPEVSETKKVPSLFSRLLPTLVIILLAIPAYLVVSNLNFCVNTVQSFFQKPATTATFYPPQGQINQTDPRSSNGDFAPLYQSDNQTNQPPFPSPAATPSQADQPTEIPQTLPQNLLRNPNAGTASANNPISPQPQSTPNGSQSPSLFPNSAQNPTQATMASDSKDNFEETSLNMQNVDVALFPKATSQAPQILHLDIPIVHEKRLLSLKADDLQKMRDLVGRIRESLGKQDTIQKELQQELKDYNVLIQKGTPEAVLNADSPSLIKNTNNQLQ